MAVSVRFKWDKSTQRCERYTEIMRQKGDEPIIPWLYVRRIHLPDPPPKRLELTLDIPEKEEHERSQA